MGRSIRKPQYSLDEAKRLVAQGRFRTALKVAQGLRNHYGEGRLDEIVRTVFDQLAEEDYHKSLELEKVPGRIADVYIGGWLDDTEWYVKFFIQEEEAIVQVFSLKENGCVW